MNRTWPSNHPHSPASLRALHALKDHRAQSDHEQPVEEMKSTKALMALLMLFVIIPVLLIFRMDPRVDRWVNNRHKPTVSMGVVQSIQYLGHMGHLDTQLNTNYQTLLVEGTAAVAKGTALEWRRSELYGDLCVVGTERCWDLLVLNSTNPETP